MSANRRTTEEIPYGSRNRRIELQDIHLAEVQKILSTDGKFDEGEIHRRSWSICEIDDKSIFGDDACRLASAFRHVFADFFYVSRVSDLSTPSGPVVAYRFETTQDEIEAFQGPSWFEFNLDDCLFFDLPVTCAVLRPGNIDKTIFVGSAAFVAEISQG